MISDQTLSDLDALRYVVELGPEDCPISGRMHSTALCCPAPSMPGASRRPLEVQRPSARSSAFKSPTADVLTDDEPHINVLTRSNYLDLRAFRCLLGAACLLSRATKLIESLAIGSLLDRVGLALPGHVHFQPLMRVTRLRSSGTSTLLPYRDNEPLSFRTS